MFGPLARITPTRLPWTWSLAVAWLVLSALSPVLAAEVEDDAADARDGLETPALTLGGWRLLPLDLTLLQPRHAAGSRLLPFAVMPMPRSALWLGVGRSREYGARLEIRWTIPLDGGAPRLPALEP